MKDVVAITFQSNVFLKPTLGTKILRMFLWLLALIFAINFFGLLFVDHDLQLLQIIVSTACFSWSNLPKFRKGYHPCTAVAKFMESGLEITYAHKRYKNGLVLYFPAKDILKMTFRKENTAIKLEFVSKIAHTSSSNSHLVFCDEYEMPTLQYNLEILTNKMVADAHATRGNRRGAKSKRPDGAGATDKRS